MFLKIISRKFSKQPHVVFYLFRKQIEISRYTQLFSKLQIPAHGQVKIFALLHPLFLFPSNFDSQFKIIDETGCEWQPILGNPLQMRGLVEPSRFWWLSFWNLYSRFSEEKYGKTEKVVDKNRIPVRRGFLQNKQKLTFFVYKNSSSFNVSFLHIFIPNQNKQHIFTCSWHNWDAFLVAQNSNNENK